MRLSVCRGDFAIRIRERFVWRAGFPGRASSGPCRRFAGSFGRAAVRVVSRGASSRPGSGGGLGRTSGCRQRFCAARLGCGRDGGCRSSAAFLPGFCWCLVVFLPDACRASAGPFERSLPGTCRISAGFLPGFRILPERFRTAAAAAYRRCGPGNAGRSAPPPCGGRHPARKASCLSAAGAGCPRTPGPRRHRCSAIEPTETGSPAPNRKAFPVSSGWRTAAAACGTGPERASPCCRWLRPERIGSAADRRGARRHGSGVFAGPGAAPVPSGDCRGGQTTAKKRTFRGAERRFVRSALRVADIFSIFACYCA